MNRKIPPPINDILKVELPVPEVISFPNGSDLYLTHFKGLPVIRLEIVIMAGRPFEKKKIVSKLTGRLLKEGAAGRTAKQISDFVDHFGGTFHSSANLDYVTLTLHCLRKYFSELWPLVSDILFFPDFPEKDLQTYIENSIQKLDIDLTKPEVIAYRILTEKIFGSEHPYGYNSTVELYKSATRQDLTEHFKRSFVPTSTHLFLSGGFEQAEVELISRTIAAWNNPLTSKPIIPSVSEISPQRIHYEIPSSVQSSLRIGRRMFSRNHPDYIDLFILNTLLGGFFGSRLNMNIRENKGMTYNIGSSLETLSYDGCFLIMAEMSHEHVEKAIKLIFKEFKKLTEEPVGEDELIQLKRYMMGTLINAIDGPFNTSSLIKSIISDQSDLGIWEKAVARIHAINADNIFETATRYLHPDDYWVVSSGKNYKS